MKKGILSVGALALCATAIAAGCGSKTNGSGETNPTSPTPTQTATPTTGSIDLTWGSTGLTPPAQVKVWLLDSATAGATCAAPPMQPSAGVLQSSTGLSGAGSLTWNTLQPGSTYMVEAMGLNTAGLPMGIACHDQVAVFAGQSTPVTLGLTAFAPNLAGTYDVAQGLNIGLPQDIQDALNGLMAVCNLIGNGTSACTTIDQIVTILTNMPVVAEWTLVQTGPGTYAGTVKWISVDGLDVTQIDLADGTFSAFVSNGSIVSYKDFNTTIQVGNLIIWLIQDVGGLDLGQFGDAGAAFIQAVAAQYVSPLDFTGDGHVLETPDFAATAIDGNLDGTLTVSTWTHDFSMSYDAVKQ